jgi:S-DNA-T family DNA segregation ATPase FtsK/SpoIIIE
MSDPTVSASDADVIPLHPDPATNPAMDPAINSAADSATGTNASDTSPTGSPDGDRMDTSYEVVLDEPAPAEPSGPVIVSAAVEGSEPAPRPVIPPVLKSRTAFDAAARRTLARWRHIAAYHVVRSPLYGLRIGLYAVAGVVRLADRQVRWWWVAEQHQLRQAAATTGDAELWLKLHRESGHVRIWRGLVLAGELLALVAGVPALWIASGQPERHAPAGAGQAHTAHTGHAVGHGGHAGHSGHAAHTDTVHDAGAFHLPHLPHGRLLLLAAAAVGVVWLAHLGRPAGKKLITGAVPTSRYRSITADVILRAYYAAKLGDPDKPGQQIQFGSTMAADGDGSRVVIDLPYGKGLDDAIKARPAIASGLDVSLSQVFITRDPTSHRRHVLWVANRDPLAIPAGRTPLLACKPTDIWEPAPFGLDERGGKVTVSMMWNSILVGAQPRQGKTFSARALALYAALDPYVRLSVFDGKGSPDWRKFALVAHDCAFGMAISRDGDPLESFVEFLRAIKADVQHRYQRLSELPAEVCPEGKLTRDIARDPRYKMPVRLVVLDEFQEYFDTPDPDANKEIGQLLVFLVKVAPAAGVIVLDATQRPSGVGSGQVAQLFTSFRDNHQIRFSLRTGSWQVSDLVLGSGAYSEGFDSSTLLPTYKGVGILRGATDATPTVRTYLADAEDAERILTAARGLREQARTLSGYAAGEETVRQVRDVLADARSVLTAGETFISWQDLAARLAEQLPTSYGQLTADAISAQIRAFGVHSVNGKRDGRVLKGVKTDAIQQAIQTRSP